MANVAQGTPTSPSNQTLFSALVRGFGRIWRVVAEWILSNPFYSAVLAVILLRIALAAGAYYGIGPQESGGTEPSAFQIVMRASGIDIDQCFSTQADSVVVFTWCQLNPFALPGKNQLAAFLVMIFAVAFCTRTLTKSKFDRTLIEDGGKSAIYSDRGEDWTFYPPDSLMVFPQYITAEETPDGLRNARDEYREFMARLDRVSRFLKLKGLNLGIGDMLERCRSAAESTGRVDAARTEHWKANTPL